jgi:hypothetical protein
MQGRKLMIRSAQRGISTNEQTVRAANPAKTGAVGHWLWLVMGLIFAASACPAVRAQAQQMPGQTMPAPMSSSGRMIQSPPMPMPGPPGLNQIFQERRVKALNAERQKELVSDTNKLLKLIADLNAQVGKKCSDSLTPDQLHMLAKIEKLAKSVKDKMSMPVQQSVFGDSFPSPIAPTGFP